MQELRALAHPLRLRLLEEFAGRPRTTMQVAASMGEPPTRLYHHVNALERAGILRLAGTRQVRGTTEKYYELSGRQFGSPRGAPLTGPMRGSIGSVAQTMFAEAQADLLAAIATADEKKPESAPVALRMLLTVSPARLARARKRLVAAIEAIQKDCRKAGEPAADAVRWALTVSLAPRGAHAKKSRPRSS